MQFKPLASSVFPAREQDADADFQSALVQKN